MKKKKEVPLRERKKPDPVKTKRKKDGTMHMSLRSEVGSSIYLLVIALNYEREREREGRATDKGARTRVLYTNGKRGHTEKENYSVSINSKVDFWFGLFYFYPFPLFFADTSANSDTILGSINSLIPILNLNWIFNKVL